MNKANRASTNDRFVKTTIQLRSKMMLGVHSRMKQLNKEDFIDYLRDLITLDLKHQLLGTFDPVCLKKWRLENGFFRKETAEEELDRIQKTDYSKRRNKKQKRYNGPALKFPGFIFSERGRKFWPILQKCREKDAQWTVDQ